MMSDAEVDYYVGYYGEKYRQVITDAIEWIDSKESVWDLVEPMDREEFIADLLENASRSNVGKE